MNDARINSAVQETAKRRAGERRNEFQRAKSLHEGISRRSGSHVYGLTEEGKPKQTRKLSSFHLVMDKWTVYMGFKREDRELLDSMPVSEIESRAKNGDVPRKVVRHHTHIIRAVRLQKHIRKGYESELAETDALLMSMDTANHTLAAIRKKHTGADLDACIACLTEVDAVLSRKEVVVKRLLTRQRVQKTVEMLEAAKRIEGNKRDFQVSRACAVFTSARNRLGGWRDRQVAGLVEYNHQKECAIRLERDRWLFSQFARFAEIPEKIHEWCLFDRNKLAVLDELEKTLKERKPNWESVLALIKANHSLFRVGKREREKAEEKIRLMEEGLPPGEHGKTDYLIGHYAWLYRFVRCKEKQKALEKIEYLRLFVNGNKPRFIFDELGQEPDLYIGPVLGPLGNAVDAFEARNFEEAKKHFALSREAIGTFVHPR
jgi:hypothetical protein